MSYLGSMYIMWMCVWVGGWVGGCGCVVVLGGCVHFIYGIHNYCKYIYILYVYVYVYAYMYMYHMILHESSHV